MNSPLEETFPLTPPEEAPKRGEEDRFTLMYHGTLVERHGLHTAINAFARLSGTFPGLRFYLFGAKTEYLTGTVLPLIKKLGLEEDIKYFGEQSQKSIATAIKGCDLGLIPNLKSAFTEINFPTRIFEYLALGKPVLVPETPGIQDYFGSDNMLFFPWGGGRGRGTRRENPVGFRAPGGGKGPRRKGAGSLPGERLAGPEGDLPKGALRPR